ncbi:hypothetical protein F7725_017580 [Dissostichus mawsoni]|uniref:Uncharacterized protein n=1 Tax=Dissostichus mawsoni TaxID=36200 RepID=A0A7J5Z809_DISMA|nr:hypothetical protein F7725_017580 [Dissostichus mawsoni]
MSMDLNSLYEGLDSYLQKFLQLFRSKRFEGIKEMTSLMESLDKDASNQRKRAAVLQGLPWYMRENPSTIMKMCEPTDPEEDVLKGSVIGILLVVEDVKEPLPASYNDVALVIEERIETVISILVAGTVELSGSKSPIVAMTEALITSSGSSKFSLLSQRASSPVALMGFIQRESLRRGGNLLRLKKCSCGRLERSGGRGGIPEEELHS